MAVGKYIDIYNDLKYKIISNEYEPGKKLPSENDLKDMFSVSRNTIRRAIGMLSLDGYVTSVHGKGVFVMEKQPLKFLVGGLQSFKEVSSNNSLNYSTDIPIFEEMIVDESFSNKSGFTVGTKVIYMVRVRNIDTENVILDINYLNANIVKDITKADAMNSIYEYVENKLGLKISGAQKIVSVVPCSVLDKKYLDLKNNNLVAVISNFVYLDNGSLFEYTESRHRPDRFKFTTFARRVYE